jgi:D-3-phosphoglycerate dehydrogenase
MKILVTCPPMLGMIDNFSDIFSAYNVEVTAPNVVQTLSENELISILPMHDGWIIGDDPATYDVFSAGKSGKLRAAVKWGIGVDNVDFNACRQLGIPIVNTPNMFGGEVSDVAVGYVIGLARHTFEIDRAVRNFSWPKPRGISLAGKTVALVGYGDIGKNIAKRLLACDMSINVYDPSMDITLSQFPVTQHVWPNAIDEADFIVFSCALNKSSYHMLDSYTLKLCKPGVRIVNVGRGPIIDEDALIHGLITGVVHSAALDVFEVEPLPLNSPLRDHPRCIFGSHNASNTTDAVTKTSNLAIKTLMEFLKGVS